MKVSQESEREFSGKEYVFTIHGSDIKMIGCIKKYSDDESDYPVHWNVKNDCFTSEAEPKAPLAPSSRSASTFQGAYDSMFSYLESMSLPPDTDI